jgi:hypothetical protein
MPYAQNQRKEAPGLDAVSGRLFAFSLRLSRRLVNIPQTRNSIGFKELRHHALHLHLIVMRIHSA